MKLDNRNQPITVFIFCTQGTYKLNVNGFEQEFNVGYIK